MVLELAACRPKDDSTPPCEEPPRVQVLLQTSDRANVGENGQSWPTKLVVYQLTGTSRLDQLDPETLKEEGEKALGDEFADKREMTAFPPSREKIELQLKPKVSHLLVVAEFREVLGSAWYATYTVPTGTKDAQCSALAKEEDPPLPCMYLAIDGSELIGGARPPAGFQLPEFGAVVCAAIGPAKKKKKAKPPPTLPDVPSTPKTPEAPSAPSGPSAPSQPTAPKAPGR